MLTKFQLYINDILNIVVKNKKYLEKNPKVLAWLMNEHDQIHYSSRYHENENMHDWINPKYAILDLYEQKLSSKYVDLIYDAWASTHKEGKKDKTKYQAIKNKKMSDFIKWKRDKSFPYKSLYPNDLSVKRYALCSSGAGLQWNKEGYLDYAGPMGTEDRIFAGFEKVKVPALILKQCSWLNDKEVKALRLKMKKFHAQKQKEEDKLKAFLKKYKLPKEKTVEPIRFELNIYCKLVNMPKNAHKSYVIAGQEICHLIEKSPTESKESKSLAKQFLKRFKKL